MDNASLLIAIIVLSWSGAPLIMQQANVNAMMMGSLLALGSLLAVSPVAVFQPYVAAGVRSVAIGLAAGVVNGLGVLAFYKLLGGVMAGQWEASKVFPAAFALIPLALAIGSRVFYGEPFTTGKIAGTVLVCAGIWVLNRG